MTSDIRKSSVLGPVVAAICLAQLLTGAPARAHLPELFGRDFVLEPPSAQVIVNKSESALEMARDINALDDEVTRRQADSGPYAADLADPVLQLAVLQAQSGNAVAALRSYEQALHVLRINNGLLHPVQLPLLRKIAGLYAQIGDMNSAQLAWRYAYRVHGLGDMPLSEEALEDALRYFAFARDAYIDPRASTDDRLFLQAYEDNRQLYEHALEEPDQRDTLLFAAGMSYLRNLYILLGTDLSGTQGLGAGGGSASASRMLSLQDLGLGNGLQILDTLIERSADDSATQRARLYLERGNWLQWNGRSRSSSDAYAAVFDLLDQTPEAQALREQLALPAVLPEDPALWSSLQRDDMPVRAVLSASFRISEVGDASNVKVNAEDEAGAGLTGRLRRMLAESHFRPALEDGIGVESSVQGQRYRLMD